MSEALLLVPLKPQGTTQPLSKVQPPLFCGRYGEGGGGLAWAKGGDVCPGVAEQAWDLASEI
jgi:hypothetical protein